jgi:hypothetical protein
VTLALLCEVEPAVLALSAATLATHEATAIWDVRTAVAGGRDVRPAEQHIHTFLESLPFMAVSALVCLHWDQVQRVLRDGGDSDIWRLRLRQPPLPRRYLAAVAAGITGLIAVPYAEELWRCLRARRRDAGARQNATADGRPGDVRRWAVSTAE